jgi:hypothetical protein
MLPNMIFVNRDINPYDYYIRRYRLRYLPSFINYPLLGLSGIYVNDQATGVKTRYRTVMSVSDTNISEIKKLLGGNWTNLTETVKAVSDNATGTATHTQNGYYTISGKVYYVADLTLTADLNIGGTNIKDKFNELTKSIRDAVAKANKYSNDRLTLTVKDGPTGSPSGNVVVNGENHPYYTVKEKSGTSTVERVYYTSLRIPSWN